MFQEFLDGSTDKAAKYLGVGGCFGSTLAWCHFQERWQAVRAELGISDLHMTDFISRDARAYQHLTPEQKYAAIAKMVSLAQEHDIYPVAVVLSLDDFYAMPESDQAVFDHNPYGLCAAQVIGVMLKTLEDLEIDEDVAYAYEVGGRGESAFVDAMHGLMVQVPEVKKILRVYTVVPVRGKSETPALDIADVVTWVYTQQGAHWTDDIEPGAYSKLVMSLPVVSHLSAGDSLAQFVAANRALPPSTYYGRSIYGRLAARKRTG